MEFIAMPINDVVLIKPTVRHDERGFFMESYRESQFYAHGITAHFVQDNHSRSTKGVLRGLHYQLQPQAQGKLVRCIRGRVFDVAVDIRPDSPTFGQHISCELSAQNQHMLWVPVGFAHGFLTLEDDTEFVYKTTAEYSPQSERGIKFNDPSLAIPWPKIDNLILSAKDQHNPLLDAADLDFNYAAK